MRVIPVVPLRRSPVAASLAHPITAPLTTAPRTRSITTSSCYAAAPVILFLRHSHTFLRHSHTLLRDSHTLLRGIC